jgi:hypothetical protein
VPAVSACRPTPGDFGRPRTMLTEADRELCSIAAQLLMGLVDPGPPREDAAERLLEHYRAYPSDAHPGADPAVLDDMAVTFSGAMLLEMEATEPGASRGSRSFRRCSS